MSGPRKKKSSSADSVLDLTEDSPVEPSQEKRKKSTSSNFRKDHHSLVPLNNNIMLVQNDPENGKETKKSFQVVFTASHDDIDIARAHIIWKLRRIICRADDKSTNTVHLPSFGFLFDPTSMSDVVNMDKENNDFTSDGNSGSDSDDIETTTQILTHWYLNSQKNVKETWIQENWNFKENNNYLTNIKEKDPIKLVDLKSVQGDHGMVLDNALVNCSLCMQNLFHGVHQDIIRAKMGCCYIEIIKNHVENNEGLDTFIISYFDDVLLNIICDCFVWWIMAFPDFCNADSEVGIKKIIQDEIKNVSTNISSLKDSNEHCNTIDIKDIKVGCFQDALLKTLQRWIPVQDFGRNAKDNIIKLLQNKLQGDEIADKVLSCITSLHRRYSNVSKKCINRLCDFMKKTMCRRCDSDS